MRIRITSDLKKVKEVSRKVLQGLQRKKLDDTFLFNVRLACEEAVINAIKYGNQLNPQKTVEITYDIAEEAVVISVRDQGSGFDYTRMPQPTTDENLLKPGGRGLFLIHQLMDKVEFNSPGNKITMTKFFKRVLPESGQI